MTERLCNKSSAERGQLAALSAYKLRKFFERKMNGCDEKFILLHSDSQSPRVVARLQHSS